MCISAQNFMHRKFNYLIRQGEIQKDENYGSCKSKPFHKVIFKQFCLLCAFRLTSLKYLFNPTPICRQKTLFTLFSLLDCYASACFVKKCPLLSWVWVDLVFFYNLRALINITGYVLLTANVNKMASPQVSFSYTIMPESIVGEHSLAWPLVKGDILCGRQSTTPSLPKLW